MTGASPGVIRPAPGRPAAAANPPRLRHGFLAVALLVVAVLRLAAGDLLWAGVLGAAGLVEVALALGARRTAPFRRTVPSADTGSATGEALPPAEVVDRSLAAHRRGLRSWSACLVVCTGVAVSLLSSAPVMSVVLAALALTSLHRVRRVRRSIAVLDRLRDPRILEEGRR